MTSTSATFSARQLFVSGSLVFPLRAFGKLTPHLAAGAGLLDAKPLRVTLIGNTQLTNFSPFDETDAVTLAFTPVGHRVVGLLGGGMKYALTSHTGIRLDLGVALGGPWYDTLVSATPTVKTFTPAGVIVTGRTPNLQFSNNPSTGFQSSLSGPAIVNLKTFAGARVRVHTGLTAGMFFRF